MRLRHAFPHSLSYHLCILRLALSTLSLVSLPLNSGFPARLMTATQEEGPPKRVHVDKTILESLGFRSRRRHLGVEQGL
jgi:hypothetical protein